MLHLFRTKSVEQTIAETGEEGHELKRNLKWWDLAIMGVAVAVLSSEAQEIIRLCDRTFVLYHGLIQDELPRERMTEENIMLLATGGDLAGAQDVVGGND